MLKFIALLKANVGMNETLGKSWIRTFQPIKTLPTSNALGKPLKSQCFITACEAEFYFNSNL